ncbi:MAG: DUF1653 domain-containing protein [Lachnospiraceae bacterium]|nr:DUF1653 domain-containing protein [Lachnospiraceae bacterium]
MREEPKELQIYKHFKGDYYQVITVAKHSETGEKLVIYRSLFSGDKVCARPLDMFLSEVDHEKYPLVKQRWRFALVTGSAGKQSDSEEARESSDAADPEDAAVDEAAEEDTNEAAGEDMEESRNNGETLNFLDEFLDADSYEKKLDVFTGMWKSLNEDNIDNVALVMDLELKGNTLEEKYKEILNCLKMKAKYESSRLR